MLTLKERNAQTAEMIKAASPGEMLKIDFMEPYGITAYRLAKSIGVGQTRVEEILDGRRAITPDTAERLSRYFGNSFEFWLNLQHDYDIRAWRIQRVSTDYDFIDMHPEYKKAVEDAKCL